jgi:hypothetical protein
MGTAMTGLIAAFLLLSGSKRMAPILISENIGGNYKTAIPTVVNRRFHVEIAIAMQLNFSSQVTN